MRILIHRQGAFGDVVITTPLIRHLKQQGNEIYYMTSERGRDVLKGNPHISKLLFHPKDSIPVEKLEERIKKVAKENKCEKIIDLSESIEVGLSQHPRGPDYNIPKYERRAKYERNFYEFTFEFAGYEWKDVDLTPELFFDEKEMTEARSHLKPGFNLLIGLAGSGGNKFYPWMDALCGSILEEYKDKVNIITVGDLRCQIIEPTHPGITNLSGKLDMRISMAMTSMVDCVICPDTGLLHAAGCYLTPKIGLIGHNTREVITKYFANDYSLEADEEKAPCAPCFRLIYDIHLQCPTDRPDVGEGAYCMSRGILPELVYEQLRKVYAQSEKRS